MSATTACLCIAATYVAPLYLWADGPRNDPGTILRRMGATLACCCVAWIPAWLSMPHVRTAAHAAVAACPRMHAQSGDPSNETDPYALHRHAAWHKTKFSLCGNIKALCICSDCVRKLP